MAGGGPAPKDLTKRRRRNVGDPETVITADDALRWHPMTQLWWDSWRSSAQAQNLVQTDWLFLIDTALATSRASPYATATSTQASSWTATRSTTTLGRRCFEYVYEPGELMGCPVCVPCLRLMATEEGQTGNVYDAIHFNLTDEALPRRRSAALPTVPVPVWRTTPIQRRTPCVST